MSKENKRIVTILAVSLTIVTVGGFLWFLGTLLGEAIWLLAKRNHQYANIEVSQNNTKEREKIKLSLVAANETFSGYSTIRHPEFKKILAEKYGIAIDYQRHDRNKEIELFNHGKVDIWTTTLDRYLEEKPKGKIVGLIDRSVGADAIVIDNKKYANFKSTDSLHHLLRSKDSQNKPGIAYVNDSSSEYFALALNDRIEEFNLKNFRTRETNQETETWKLLKNSRSVAMGVVSEPYVTLAEKQGYEVLLSSKDLDKSIVHVIVASDRTLEVNPEKVIQFLEAYYYLIDRNVLEPVKIKEYIANESKISLEEAEKVLTKIDFFTAAEARNWMQDGTLEASLDSISSILLSAGKIKEIPDNYQAFFTSEYLERASTNTAKLISELENNDPKLAERLAGIGETIAIENYHTKIKHLEEEHSHEKYINRGKEKFSSEPEHREHHHHLAEFKTTKLGNLKWRGKIGFEFGSAKLNQESIHVLEHVAERISELNPETVAIRVIGHTSKSGTLEANQILSQQRAEAVIDVLQKRGLTHKFIGEGKGFNDPLPNYAPEDPKQQRTQIIIERIRS